MKQTPIGLIIKEVAHDKNLKVSKLAELSGKSRQGIYVTFGRSEMSDEELSEWAKTLGVTKQYLFDRWKTDNQDEANSDSSYLMEHLSNLEEQFKRLLNQLETKDSQIQSLTEMLKMTLGKLSPAAGKSKVMKMYPEEAAA